MPADRLAPEPHIVTITIRQVGVFTSLQTSANINDDTYAATLAVVGITAPANIKGPLQ